MIEREGWYLVPVDWLNPQRGFIGKAFGIFINSSLKAQANCNNFSRVPNTLRTEVYLTEGLVNLLIVMLPVSVPDGAGIMIANVSLF